MQLKNFIMKLTAGILSAFLLAVYGRAGYYSANLPDHITAESDEISFGAYPDLTIGSVADNRAAVSLMGAIPVKSVAVSLKEPPTLIAGGSPFGIKLLMEGVMVTDMGKVNGASCPAEDAGVELGDVITYANSIPLSSNSDLQRIISDSKGEAVSLRVKRDGREFEAVVSPVYSKKDKKWRSGMWVRDSIAGIGTLTFIDKATGQFTGLGHPICDADTGELVPLHSGEAVPVKITETRKGQAGQPGELHGQFTGQSMFGTLSRNSGCGVSGKLTEASAKNFSGAEEYKMGYRQDVKIGDAYILTTVSGNEPKKYSIRIEEVDYNSSEASKNMVIRITDKELIDASGGIVQGMSGSPIIQDDRLIGAVTHVFVADPTKGYAVFAENMYKDIM